MTSPSNTDREQGDELDEWWDWNYADEWNSQLWEFGYAELTHDDEAPFPDARVALLAEVRWVNGPHHDYVPSALWDGHVHRGYLSVDRKARARVRAAMPEYLALWANRRKAAKRLRGRS